MATVAVIGEDVRVRGFALAGARVYPAASAEQARAAWAGLPADVAVVVLTPQAARWLRDAIGGGALGGWRARGTGPSPAPGAGPAARPAPPRRDLLPVVMPP